VSSVEDDPVFDRPDSFQPPRWLPKADRKHIPEPGWTWTSVIERSQGREADSWYHPLLSHAEIERIEMGALRNDLEVKAKRRSNVRFYWRHLGTEIGASKGVPTEYVYVNYAQEGGVHGFPITLDELRRKGVKP
jgi:hypothetical protein